LKLWHTFSVNLGRQFVVNNWWGTTLPANLRPIEFNDWSFRLSIIGA
jgi:hypothetical protein